jgi:hypothetical protein
MLCSSLLNSDPDRCWAEPGVDDRAFLFVHLHKSLMFLHANRVISWPLETSGFIRHLSSLKQWLVAFVGMISEDADVDSFNTSRRASKSSLPGSLAR